MSEMQNTIADHSPHSGASRSDRQVTCRQVDSIDRGRTPVPPKMGWVPGKAVCGATLNRRISPIAFGKWEIIAFITRSMSGCPGLAEQKALLRPIELESILEWQAPYEFSHLLQHLGLVGKEDEMIRLQADDACIGQRRFEYGRIVSF